MKRLLIALAIIFCVIFPEGEIAHAHEQLMEITWYTSNDFGMVGDGITASGTHATEGRTIAASREYPFGTQMIIDGHLYIVEDRGSAITRDHIDIYTRSHTFAIERGRQIKWVEIIESEEGY